MSDNHYFLYWGKSDRSDAKTTKYHLLPYHSLDVAAVGSLLLKRNHDLRKRFGEILGWNDEALLAILPFFIALHDLGKFAESFQSLKSNIFNELRGRAPKKVYSERHDSLGYVLWKKNISDVVIKLLSSLPGSESNDRLSDYLDAFARAVTGHHGTPPTTRSSVTPTNIILKQHFTNDDVSASTEFVKDSFRLFPPRSMKITLDMSNVEFTAKPFSWLMAGFTVLCDWIGSNIPPDEMISKPMDLSEYWNRYALPNAERLTKEAGVLPSSVSLDTGMATLFPALTNRSALQKVTETYNISDAPQLFIIEDLTGTGKTEAALTLAHRIMANGNADGLYVALPTMATANAMYERIAKAYRSLFEPDVKPSLVLAHGDSRLVKEFTDSILPLKEGVSRDRYGQDEETAIGRCTQWLADNRKKSLLADVGIGTIDQALIAVLKSKYQSLRLFGLFRKVLIVDEVHACDSYMNKILKGLLEFHLKLGGSAILLSATLPTAMKNEFAEAYGKDSKVGFSKSSYPLITHVADNKSTEIEIPSVAVVEKKVSVRFLHNEAEVEKYLLDSAREGLCACWIRNTVHDAMEAYEKLKKLSDIEVLLFHARFTMGDRLDTEKTIKSYFGKGSISADRRGKILIATQVVEQSLDLDFDVMVSDLAPIDSLIQRAGRLRRHARDSKGDILTGKNDLDERGEISLVVLGPKLVDNPSEDWYSRFFPKGAYVYPFHGQLWLTAKLLADEGGWSMPRDARNHVEKVFGDRLDIPPALKERDDLAKGEDNAKSSYAHNSMLDFDDGYIKDALWDDDIDAVTRIGEMSSTLYLARWDGKGLKPWSDDDDHPWEYSRLSVRSSLVKGEASHTDPLLKKAVELISNELPGKGKYGILIPLEKGDDDLWYGTAVNGNGNEVEIVYSNSFGLSLK